MLLHRAMSAVVVLVGSALALSAASSAVAGGTPRQTPVRT